MLMPSLDTSIANAGLPSLATAFEASFHEVQWIVLMYLLAITTLIVSAGRLGDLIGRRRLMLIGIGLSTAASLLCGLSSTLWMLVTARAFQGLGAAVMLALAVSFVGETVPKTETGRAMGLLGTVSALGTTLGPSLGGVLIAGAGWQAIFLINLPLGLLNLVLAYRFLPADQCPPKAHGGGIDYLGSMLLAMTLAAYALAMTLGGGHFGQINLVLILLTFLVATFLILSALGVALGSYVRVEMP